MSLHWKVDTTICLARWWCEVGALSVHSLNIDLPVLSSICSKGYSFYYLRSVTFESNSCWFRSVMMQIFQIYWRWTCQKTSMGNRLIMWARKVFLVRVHWFFHSQMSPLFWPKWFQIQSSSSNMNMILLYELVNGLCFVHTTSMHINSLLCCHRILQPTNCKDFQLLWLLTLCNKSYWHWL